MYSCMCSSPDCRVLGCAAARKRDVQSPISAHIQLGQYVDPAPHAAAPHVVQGLVKLGAQSVKPSVKQGWECPRCRAILAPHVERCNCKASA